jgi:protein-tyrosine-phosphatase
MANGVRALALKVRHGPDRALHERRRRATQRQLAGAGRPRSVLILCHGNVCRSPFAAALVEREVAELGDPRVEVTSAGFVGPDRASPDNGLLAAQSFGIDMSGHVSALVTPERVRASDVVVVMSSAQKRQVSFLFPERRGLVLVLGDLDPLPIAKRTILDPWNGDVAMFAESYVRIARCTTELVKAFAGQHAG